jgi:hypothetical protein
MIVKIIDKVPEVRTIIDKVSEFINNYDSNAYQLMCQTLKDGISDVSTGIGRIADLEVPDESMYRYIEPSLKGSCIEDLILKYSAVRTRIMRLPPRSCYSVHADPTPRIHIPLITNKQCWMIWPYQSICKNLEVGNVYWTDTRLPHTFINGDEFLERIHIVMVLQ